MRASYYIVEFQGRVLVEARDEDEALSIMGQGQLSESEMYCAIESARPRAAYPDEILELQPAKEVR